MRVVRTKPATRMTFGGSGSRKEGFAGGEIPEDGDVGRVFGAISGLEGRLARERPDGHWEPVHEEEPVSGVDAVLRHVPQDDVGVALVDETPLEIGAQGERAALAYLEREGYEILETNWTCPAGEADIIALDGPDCVFVEVKTRLETSPRQTIPELAVGRSKQLRYQRIASYYVSTHEVRSLRYDVIAVSIVSDGIAKVRHYRSAFGGDW